MSPLESILEKLESMYRYSPIGTIYLIVAAIGIFVATLLVLYVILSLIFEYIDTAFISSQSARGRVTNKLYSPFHIKQSLVYNFALYMPLFAGYNSPNWTITVEVLGEIHLVPVISEIYENVNLDSLVNVEYIIGRLTKKTHIKNVTV